MNGSTYLGACRIKIRIATNVNVQRFECSFLIAGRNNSDPATEDVKSKRREIRTDTEGNSNSF